MSSCCVGEGATVRAAESAGLFPRRCAPSSWKAAGKRFYLKNPSIVVYLLPFFLVRFAAREAIVLPGVEL